MASIRHQVWIDAPLQTVYALISTAEGVSQWWDPQSERMTPDGPVWEHHPGPEHGTVAMRVLSRLEGRLVEWECISEHKRETPASAWTGTRVRFELSPREAVDIANQKWSSAIPGQTVLSFEHSAWDGASPYLAFCSFAWAEVLQKLASTAEKKGRA